MPRCNTLSLQTRILVQPVLVVTVLLTVVS